MLHWYEDDNGVHKCLLHGVTVGKIRYAKEGEAEGGLGALARFMLGALHPGVEQPPPSPAGLYWQATAERGVWSRPAYAEDIEAARAAVEEHVQNLK